MCKKHFETSYSVVNNNLFKVNNGCKEIIDFLGRIDPNEYKSCISNNDNDTFTVEHNELSLPDYCLP